MTVSMTIHTFGPAGSTCSADATTACGPPSESDTRVWVDVLDPTPEELDHLLASFSLHPLAIEDATEHGQRAKLDHYPDHAFLVGYSLEMAEVDLFIGPTWVISVRERNEHDVHWATDVAQERLQRVPPDQVTVGLVVYTLLDELVDGYFTAADSFEDRVEAFEDRVLSSDGAHEQLIQGDLLRLRRELLVFRRTIVPLRDVINALLRGEVSVLDAATLVHLQDVLDHLLRAIDQIDSQRELLGNAVDAHLAVISNRMNLVMKRMTSWGAILLGSTLVAGIYGMNFEHMPELSWAYGYPFALGLMAAITLVAYRIFKRYDWL